MTPPFATGENGPHEPSGVGVSPRRTLSASVVPLGMSATYDSAPQSAVLPASWMRDRKVPGDA